MKTTRISYMYRDGSNYKNGTCATLSNPDQISLEEADQRIKNACDQGQYFIAHQVGLAEAFLWNADACYDPDNEATYPPDLGAGKYVITDDDHCWHEYCGLDACSQPPNTQLTLKELIERFEQASEDGWLEFEPGHDRPTPKEHK